MRKKAAILAGVLVVILLSSWVAAQGYPGNPRNGKALFEQHCSRCHGEAGDGNGGEGRFLVVPPANFQSARSRVKTDLELFTAISHGVLFSPMHGWRGRLTDDEIWDVISYIRMLAPFSPIS